jgi:hypothetical protein
VKIDLLLLELAIVLRASPYMIQGFTRLKIDVDETGKIARFGLGKEPWVCMDSAAKVLK